jgi:integrase/recombinase XerD
LNGYEKWMADKGKKQTTVGIYLRPLRAIFNTAISAGEIEKDLYPFGKNKYEIPGGGNTKKALDKKDLKALFSYDAEENSPIEKARDFWFLSYMANGMNIRDICELKYSNVENDKFTFIRTKTKRITKKNPKPITVIITDPLRVILNKYSNKNTGPHTYVFPIFTHKMDATEKVRACESFTRFINQHIKKLAEKVGVDTDISTYYARHSHATISVQNGASLEFIQEAFGHQSITTTQNYFAGFDEGKKKENANKLMDFE